MGVPMAGHLARAGFTATGVELEPRGVEPPGESSQHFAANPEALRRCLQSDAQRWRPALRSAGIQPE
jgi:3-hydroxyisobutyrate dehydrogenase-like beta-hydroxyacid dehydrogenase